MRKVTIVFGLLAGIILSVFFVIGMQLYEGGMVDFANSDLLGYASMVVALSMVFFGIKSYRDNYRNGAIGFWKGFLVGMLITLVASVIYAVSLEAYYQADPEGQNAFMDQMCEYQINSLRDSGASPAEIDAKTQQLADLKQMIQNPVLRFLFTFVIILPVGIVVTLISAGVLRKREFLPA